MDRRTFHNALLGKTDNNVFQAFFNRVSNDRTFIDKYLILETKLHQTDRAIMQCVTIDHLEHELRDKPSCV